MVLFGFSFKEDTDDIRNSVSINISLKLIQEGCFLKIYDPKVPSDIIINSLTNRTSKVNNNSILSKVYVSNNPYFILKNSDALIISTK
ncbi:hypothetical protein E5P55_00470 [Candidatus Pinguicoccus supinus]|uniref:UDP-glucose/GDP-mannose dehydrogenase C-terminal domain-containing protein n=1 Tax=Candidatus Pinguicoccus supinus TaxID=2529394 RepID=A0A7T0FY59_9BACT|nr:hypothetical protein E5P55_00470 [Candidatus Pinguicoccus supinus]